MDISKARVKEGRKEARRQLDTCDLFWEAHTIPEVAFHLGLGRTHTRPMQELQSRSAAAALVVAKAGAGFTGSVAGLTFTHLWVAVEARATVPHATAACIRTQRGNMKAGGTLGASLGTLCRAKF